MTFRKFYAYQFLSLRRAWRIARENRIIHGLIIPVLILLNPLAVYVAYLYETGRVEVGGYMENGKSLRAGSE